MIQGYRSVHAAVLSFGTSCVVRNEDSDLRAGGRLSLSSLSASFFSADLLKSKAVAGVFGVLLALPNDANAPLPRPKADDAPDVGDAVDVVLMLPKEVKGLRLL